MVIREATILGAVRSLEMVLLVVVGDRSWNWLIVVDDQIYWRRRVGIGISGRRQSWD